MSAKNCNICYIRQLTSPLRKGRNVYDVPLYNNGVTSPPMGWSSWNCFRNNIDSEKILGIAEALIKTGLAEKGYKFVNLDDNWHSSMRDANGNLQGDLERFPLGIPELINKINGMGLKVGLYSSNGTLTCEDLPASFGNEEKDATLLAKWGVEFFKYDFCHHHPYSSKAPLISAISFINSNNSEIKEEFKAEEGILGGQAKIISDKKMPCGSYVKGLNKNKGIVIFDFVTVPKQGEYILTVTTKKRGNYEKFLAVEINGDEPKLLTIPACKVFNNTARVQCVVNLKEGNNIIKFYNPIEKTADGYVLQYRYMGKMLKQATYNESLRTASKEKPITYSICEWGRNRPWLWGATAGNQWRTTPDIRPWWFWMMIIYNHNVRLYKYSVKGGYNDPDMLEVGNGKLSFEENKSHFTLWAMMNAPLILGNDLRKFIDENGNVDETNPTLKILKNEKIIALNQDEKGKACKRLKCGIVDVLAKPLSDGTAFCFFNRSRSRKTFKCDLTKFCEDEYIEFDKSDKYFVEDLWTNDKTETDGKISIQIPPHGVVVYKIPTVCIR